MSINPDEVSKVSSDLLEKLKTGRPISQAQFDREYKADPRPESYLCDPDCPVCGWDGLLS